MSDHIHTLCEIFNQQMYFNLAAKILRALPEDHPAQKLESLLFANDEFADYGEILSHIGRLMNAQREEALAALG